MGLQTQNLNEGGLLQARQGAKRARFRAFYKRLQKDARRVRLEKALLGVGNPQGDLDVLAQEAAVDGDTRLQRAIEKYLQTQDADDVAPIVATLDELAEFWLALAQDPDAVAGEDSHLVDLEGTLTKGVRGRGMRDGGRKKCPMFAPSGDVTEDSAEDKVEGQGSGDTANGARKKQKGWLRADGRRYFDNGKTDMDEDAEDDVADDDDEGETGDLVFSEQIKRAIGNRKKKKTPADKMRAAREASDAAMSATAENVEDSMGAVKGLHYAIKGLMGNEERITYGVVYPVNKVDLQGEWADRELVEKAAHRWLELYRQADTEHSWRDVGGAVVESYIAPCDLHEFFGKRLDAPIREGAWVMAYRWKEPEWQEIKKGKINGYSLGGLKRVKSGVAPPAQ